MFAGLGSPLVMLDLTFNDNVTANTLHFFAETREVFNLLISYWINTKTYRYYSFWGREIHW